MSRVQHSTLASRSRKSGMPKKPSNILRLKKTYHLKIRQSIFYKGKFCFIFSTPKHIPQAQNEKNRWISQNLLIICLKPISEERFLFNGNVIIINASLKFLIKVPTQKALFLQKSLQKPDILNQFQKLFKPALWYCFNINLLKFFSTIFFFLHFFLFTWNIFLWLVFRSCHISLNI